jgi:hypothetical protein
MHRPIWLNARPRWSCLSFPAVFGLIEPMGLCVPVGPMRMRGPQVSPTWSHVQSVVGGNTTAVWLVALGDGSI